MFGHQRKQVAQMLPFSPRLLVGIIAGVIVAVWLLFSTPTGHLENQLRDQDWAGAWKTLSGLPAKTRNTDPRRYALLEVRLRRQLLELDDLEGQRLLLRDAFQLAQPYQFPEEFLREIESVFEKMPDALAGYEVLRPILPQLPAEYQARFMDLLAAKALAAANPMLAARIYLQFWQSRPDSPEVTGRMVELARQAGQPGLALQALEAYARNAGQPLARLSPRLALLHVTLLRENNQPGPAFEAMWEYYSGADAESRNALFPELLVIARQSDRVLQLLPEIQRRAESQPESVTAWRTLAEMAMAAGNQPLAMRAVEQLARLSVDDGAIQFRHGQLLEWNHHPNEAFDQYLKALRLGEMAAIDRLIALNPGLYRDIELAAALHAADPHVDKTRYGLALARVYANIGEFNRAIPFFEEAIQRRPDDFKLAREFGQLLLDLGDYKRASEIFARLLKSNLADPAAAKSLAESQFLKGDNLGALQTYRKLLQAAPDRELVESFVRLAESLGRIEEAAAALSRYVRGQSDISTRDFLRLSYFYTTLGRRDELIAHLRTGVEKFPTDPLLRKQLFYAYSDGGHFAEAADVLAHDPALLTEPALARQYLALLSQAKRFREAEEFINGRMPRGLLDDKETLAMIAGIYSTTGNREAALGMYERLFRRDPSNTPVALAYAQLLTDFNRPKDALAVLKVLPETADPAAWKLLAQIYALAQDYREAQVYQRKYLLADAKATAQDWGFLGDIHATRGDNSAARRAYLTAINRLLTLIAGTVKP